jgi:ParB-like chromosome segregation protein Spo0J
MPNIALELVHDNPFRDFELHPLDEAQVKRLEASINADGFWASVVARKTTGGYQIAYGHHRIAAAKSLGWTHVPIEVRDLSDWQMINMLASENATQRGSTAAAALDAIAALSKGLTYNLLRWEDEATFLRNMGNIGFSYQECRGRLEAHGQIGRECIMGCPPEGRFTTYQVEAALGTLKDSGRMAAILAEARARIEAELHDEQEAAARELAAALRKEASAKTKREKAAAAQDTRKASKAVAKTNKASAAAGKAVAAVQRKPVVYDARCAQLFKLDSHAETFRKIVTGETFQSYLKLDQQFAFAKQVLAGLHEAMPGKEITARDIRTECWARIETGLGMTKGKMRTAPERPYLEEIKEGLNLIRRAEGDFKRGVALLLRGFQLGEQLDTKQAERLDKMEQTFAVGWSGMKPHRENVKRHLKLIEGK